MTITSGFFNSINGDRRYDAEDMSAIFDGIINDGVFQSVGTAFQVKATTGRKITVGIGRCWFNSTWMLNDSILPITLSPSHILYDRWDAVVIDIDHNEKVRTATISVVMGTEETAPKKPTPIHDTLRNQYVLAYIYRRAGSDEVRQADITNNIGTSTCPYVNGILEVQNIDKIVAQWEDQWSKWYGQTTTWEGNWNRWFSQTNQWERDWNDWFAENTSGTDEELGAFLLDMKVEIQNWFDKIKDNLNPNTAANLSAKIADLQTKFETLANERAIYDSIHDSSGNAILGSDGTEIVGKVVFDPGYGGTGEGEYENRAYTAKLLVNGWTGDGSAGYTQIVSCAGMTSGKVVLPPVFVPTGIKATDTATRENIAKIDMVETLDEQIQVTCWDSKPDADLEITLLEGAGGGDGSTKDVAIGPDTDTFFEDNHILTSFGGKVGSIPLARFDKIADDLEEFKETANDLYAKAYTDDTERRDIASIYPDAGSNLKVITYGETIQNGSGDPTPGYDKLVDLPTVSGATQGNISFSYTSGMFQAGGTVTDTMIGDMIAVYKNYNQGGVVAVEKEIQDPEGWTTWFIPIKSIARKFTAYASLFQQDGDTSLSFRVYFADKTFSNFDSTIIVNASSIDDVRQETVTLGFDAAYIAIDAYIGVIGGTTGNCDCGAYFSVDNNITENIRPITSASQKMAKLVLNGASDEPWQLETVGSTKRFKILISSIGKYPLPRDYTNQYASILKYDTDLSDEFTFFIYRYVYGGGTTLFVSDKFAKDEEDLRDKLSRKPITFWYIPVDESAITGTYIPHITEGEEYRCQCVALNEHLLDDDTFDTETGTETHVSSLLTLTGTETVYQAGTVGNEAFYCFLKVPDSNVKGTNVTAVCSHFKNANTAITLSNVDAYSGCFSIGNDDNGPRFAIPHRVIGTTSATSAGTCLTKTKEYFKAQYSAGKPIQIAYQMNAPKVYENNPIRIEAKPDQNGLVKVYGESDISVAYNKSLKQMINKEIYSKKASNERFAKALKGKAEKAEKLTIYPDDQTNIVVTSHGFTTQSGSGDASLSNVRTLKVGGMQVNLLTHDITTKTAYGVTATSNKDGTITFKGTATGSAWFNLFATFRTPITGDLYFSGRANGFARSYIYFDKGESNNGAVFFDDRGDGVSFKIAPDAGYTRMQISVNVASGTSIDATVGFVLSRVKAPYTPYTGAKYGTVITTNGDDAKNFFVPLNAPLCEGDTLQTNVPSGCDKVVVFDGSVDERWNIANWGSGGSGSKGFICSLGNNIPRPSNSDLYTKSVAYANRLNNEILDTIASYRAEDSCTILYSKDNSEIRAYARISGVSTIEDFRKNLSDSPLIIRYQSIDYTSEKDLPVCLETHQQWCKTLDGTEAGLITTSSNRTVNVQLGTPLGKGDGSSGICSIAKTAWDLTGNGYFIGKNSQTMTFGSAYSAQFESYEAFQAKMAELYAAGTPAQVVYPLAAPAVYAHDPIRIEANPNDDGNVVITGETSAMVSAEYNKSITRAFEELQAMVIALGGIADV